MAGAEDAIAMLDDLDQQMQDLYFSYAETATESWSSFVGNHGQMVIIENHILPAALEHAHQACKFWPIGEGPDEYFDTLMNCYDAEVISRAFSQTIDQITAELWDPVYEAQEYEDAHNYIIDAIQASAFGPHSTQRYWQDGGGWVA